MSNFLIAIMFGAGVAAWVYGKMGRRIGYGNTQNIVIFEAVVFILASGFFYTVLALFIPQS